MEVTYEITWYSNVTFVNVGLRGWGIFPKSGSSYKCSYALGKFYVVNDLLNFILKKAVILSYKYLSNSEIFQYIDS